jgi:hypothetical protein
MLTDESSDPIENGCELCVSLTPIEESYADYLQGPEIQTMYSLNMPVAKVRAKVREEFEKHRYVNNLPAVDVLLAQSHMEFQVRIAPRLPFIDDLGQG